MSTLVLIETVTYGACVLGILWLTFNILDKQKNREKSK